MYSNKPYIKQSKTNILQCIQILKHSYPVAVHSYHYAAVFFPQTLTMHATNVTRFLATNSVRHLMLLLLLLFIVIIFIFSFFIYYFHHISVSSIPTLLMPQSLTFGRICIYNFTSNCHCSPPFHIICCRRQTCTINAMS